MLEIKFFILLIKLSVRLSDVRFFLLQTIVFVLYREGIRKTCNSDYKLRTNSGGIFTEKIAIA